MCIVAFAWQIIPDMPLALLSNRDEFFARPTQRLHQWQDKPIVAGRDDRSGGTWLGLNPATSPANPRWAVVLNIREAGAEKGVLPAQPVSRGSLAVDYLTSDMSPYEFAQSIALQDFEGFNLILGDLNQAVVVNNRGQAPKRLENGLHVFSNGGLVDDVRKPWFKCERLRGRVRQEVLPLMQEKSGQISHWQRAAFDVLADAQQTPDDELPDTGVPRLIEKRLSSVFINLPTFMNKGYGTRVSTLLSLSEDGSYELLEKSHEGEALIQLQG